MSQISRKFDTLRSNLHSDKDRVYLLVGVVILLFRIEQSSQIVMHLHGHLAAWEFSVLWSQ